MKRNYTALLVWALLAVGSAALVVVADRQGWLAGRKRQAATQDCTHGLVANQCPFCDESLVAKRGFCAEHGVPEAYCTTCDPAVIAAFKASGDWCGGHDVPESQCTICNPGILDKYATATEAVAPPPAIELLAVEALPRNQRPPSVTCTTQKQLVQFQSPDIASAAGLEYARVARRQVPQTLTCNAEIAYDANRHAQVSARAGGVVAKVQVDLGQTVATGGVLAVVDSAAVSTAKAEYLRLWQEAESAQALAKRTAEWFDRVNRMEVRLTASDYLEQRSMLSLAKQTLAREEALNASGVTTEQELERARNAAVRAENAVGAVQRKLLLYGIPATTIASLEPEQINSLEGQGTTSEQPLLAARQALAALTARLSAARDHLRVFGLSDAQIKQVRTDGDVSGLLAVTAPFTGTVVARQVALGEVVPAGQGLFEVADTSRVWAMLDVCEADMRQIRKGLPVVLDVGGLVGERHSGRITWLSSQLDSRTRTLKARTEIANPKGLLRAGMFGKAEVTVRREDDALVIPRGARQWDGCCNVVFVKRSEVLFEPRKVRLGHATDRFFVVEEGLVDGEQIVTTGSFLLKTEILKGSIGAGCCEVELGSK
jgi:membrane fusion protein, heavy metal efflux system